VQRKFRNNNVVDFNPGSRLKDFRQIQREENISAALELIGWQMPPIVELLKNLVYLVHKFLLSLLF
jgi:hypothetical protein